MQSDEDLPQQAVRTQVRRFPLTCLRLAPPFPPAKPPSLSSAPTQHLLIWILWFRLNPNPSSHLLLPSRLQHTTRFFRTQVRETSVSWSHRFWCREREIRVLFHWVNKPAMLETSHHKVYDILWSLLYWGRCILKIIRSRLNLWSISFILYYYKSFKAVKHFFKQTLTFSDFCLFWLNVLIKLCRKISLVLLNERKKSATIENVGKCSKPNSFCSLPTVLETRLIDSLASQDAGHMAQTKNTCQTELKKNLWDGEMLNRDRVGLLYNVRLLLQFSSIPAKSGINCNIINCINVSDSLDSTSNATYTEYVMCVQERSK